MTPLVTAFKHSYGALGMELFHRIADAACGRVRKAIVELGLEASVSFRNVDTGSEAKLEYQALAGQPQVPVLKANGQLYVGEDAILSFLRAVAAI
jgi:glutathione S-transferase